MTSFLLWIYLALAISCAFLTVAWGHVAGGIVRARHRERNFRPLIWSKSFLVSTGLSIHAFAMLLATGYRSFDLYMTPGEDITGSEPYFFAYFLCMLLISMIILVWAASTNEMRQKIRWPWTAYVAALICLTVFVGIRGLS